MIRSVSQHVVRTAGPAVVGKPIIPHQHHPSSSSNGVASMSTTSAIASEEIDDGSWVDADDESDFKSLCFSKFTQYAQAPPTAQEVEDAAQLIFPSAPAVLRMRSPPPPHAATASGSPVPTSLSPLRSKVVVDEDIMQLGLKISQIPEVWQAIGNSNEAQQVFSDYAEQKQSEHQKCVHQPGTQTPVESGDSNICSGAGVKPPQDNQPGAYGVNDGEESGPLQSVLAALQINNIRALLSSSWNWLREMLYDSERLEGEYLRNSHAANMNHAAIHADSSELFFNNMQDSGCDEAAGPHEPRPHTEGGACHCREHQPRGMAVVMQSAVAIATVITVVVVVIRICSRKM